MGYRLYFYTIEKTKLKEIQSLGEEAFKLQYCPNEWFNVFLLLKDTTCIFELGTSFDTSYMESTEIFSKHIYDTYIGEKDLKIVGEKGIKDTIEQIRLKIIESYKSVLKVTPQDKMILTSKDGSDADISLSKMRNFLQIQLSYWEENPHLKESIAVDVNKERPNITDSWIYEHIIFELVRLYKTIDYDKYEVLLLGY